MMKRVLSLMLCLFLLLSVLTACAGQQPSDVSSNQTDTDGSFAVPQRLMLAERREDFPQRAATTAGITLEFDTDSRSLALELVIIQGVNLDFYGVSVLADGVPVGKIDGKMPDFPQTTEASARFDLGEGRKRVKVCLPWSAAACIRSAELDDGAFFAPVPPRKRGTGGLLHRSSPVP